MELCRPSVIKKIMEENGIRFRKEYGQNFLIDPTVPERIADECADTAERLILEIGPGIGCLTQELCLRYKKVLAVEIDKGLIPVLGETLREYGNVTVLNDDVMEVDLPALVAREAEGLPVSVAANLPYYITTPILMRLLESGVPFDSITVMVQKEVADRLTALPGSADYGAITAVLGYYGAARRLFTVSAGSFMPAPKVDSAVIRLDLYKEKPICPADESLFFRVIKGAFEQRRKTLLNALSAKLGMSKDVLLAAFAEAELASDIRGERLSTAAFAALADAIHKRV